MKDKKCTRRECGKPNGKENRCLHQKNQSLFTYFELKLQNDARRLLCTLQGARRSDALKFPELFLPKRIS